MQKTPYSITLFEPLTVNYAALSIDDSDSDGKYSLCAFHTIAPRSIVRKTLPDRLAKKLPGYPVPVFLLAQLAVHQDYKGRGPDKVTLIKALEHLYDINAHMRAYAVIVDCLNENISTFYEQFGFELLSQENNHNRLFLPMKTVKLLLGGK